MKPLRNKPLFLLLFAFFALVYADCFSQQGRESSHEDTIQKSQEYYSRGKELLAQGDYTAADEAFKKAQYFLSALPAAAAAQATGITQPVAMPLAPAPALSASEEAFAASQKGASEEAIKLYQKAIALTPQDADLYYNLALEYLKTNQFGKAGESFKKVLRLNPKDKNAYYNLGVLYESYLQDKRQALVYFSQYLKFASSKDKAAEVREWIRQIKKELRPQ